MARKHVGGLADEETAHDSAERAPTLCDMSRLREIEQDTVETEVNVVE